METSQLETDTRRISERPFMFASQFQNLNTTTVNQVLGLPGLFSTFLGPQLLKLRIIAISASVASIFACITGIYLLTSIDRRRKVFRHHLIFYLFVCDFLKAIVLLIYPVVILRHNQIYGYPGFYNTVGWLTAYAIEGADIAIFIFALHFAILIFRPNWKWRNSSTGNMEGGFFKWRRFIYPFTALTPTVLASLAFIDFTVYNEELLLANSNVVSDNNNFNFAFQAKVGGYKPLSAWCYLPPTPVWYKVVLSWGPRYFIFLTICTLYVCIYVFVNKEGRKIKSELKEFRHTNEPPVNFFNRKPSLNATLNVINGMAFVIKYYLKKFLSFLKTFFFLQLMEDNESHQHDMLTVKNVQRAGTPGICVRSDSESDLSSRFNFSPDDVDIEDGYNSDSNNGLHLFNHSSSWNCTAAASNNGRPYQSAYTNPTIPPLVQVQQPSNLYLSSRTSNIPLHSSSSPNDMSEMLEQNAQNMLIQSGGTQLDVEKMEHVPEKDVAGVKHKFQSEMYAHFKIKRDQIRRQLKSIFIYPLAYLILWVFPFVVDCSQYSHEVYHGPIVWLAYIATFMQPLNGVVDVAVFMFREQPWRYSWASIHSKELINRYKLKGEIGETDITNMCESDWGRRGWYYRGRWRKEECWKHQPQCWKRICWYTGRFLVGLWKNKFIYEDNCMDRNYWDAYYGKQTSKTFSLSTTNKMTPISHQSLTPSSGSSDNGLDAYKNKIDVKFLWRVIHLLPLQEGIDLDELDRYLKFKNKYDDFVIPGLQLAIEQNISTNNNTLFKPDYSLSGHTGEKDSTNDNSHSRHSTPLETPIMKTFDLGDISNMNFADVTANPNLPGISANAGRSENSKEEQLDLLSFLKGEPQP